MSSARKEVFLSKVLTRLYPNTADLQTVLSKNESVPKGTGEKPKEAIQPPITEPAVGIEKSELSKLKVYTASLPPGDYIPPPQTDLQPSSSEDSELQEDCPGAVSKRRRRKRKRLNLMNDSTLEREQNLQQTPHPSQASDSGKINKNKKRKLQRKRQKERLKAEGLWPKGRTCQSDVSRAEGNAAKESDEQTEEDQRKKREDLLEFLQATQELYFSDSKSRCADPTLMAERILEILDQMKSGTVPFSEVQLLHNLKSLLLLQDIERLNNSLDSFKEQSSMPLDHIKAFCSLFDYWIMNILPIKTKPTYLKERENIENKIITSQAVGPEVTQITAAFRRRSNKEEKSPTAAQKEQSSIHIKDVAQTTKLVLLWQSSVNMVLCYRRITPGYIRLLQIQTARKIIVNGTDILMERAAMLLGAAGIWISSYSTRKMIK